MLPYYFCIKSVKNHTSSVYTINDFFAGIGRELANKTAVSCQSLAFLRHQLNSLALTEIEYSEIEDSILGLKEN